uniref:Reverse transcriptase zinc-binding domain-containing protein n=1 Tax=Quercus lobata TaxID=97700 RepID=A0A7N2MUR8_QUELO
MGYIGAHGVAALHRYKYSGVDHSYVAKYVLQPFWSRFVHFFPLWMPYITLIGFMFLVVSALLGYIYSPRLDSAPPRWVHFAHGLLLFLYQTFDAVDGKQARRTNSSSPLGELFDHGCDAIACALEALAFGSTAMCGRDTFWFWVISAVPFYGATWESYFTNTLILPAINGPTEGLMLIYFVHFFTAIVGAEWWAQQFGKSIPFLSWVPFLHEIPTSRAALFLMIAFAVIPTITFKHAQRLKLSAPRFKRFILLKRSSLNEAWVSDLVVSISKRGRSWNLLFRHGPQDWEAATVYSFFKFIYSSMPRGEGDDHLVWRLTTSGVFDVPSFYKLLSGPDIGVFPWECIWSAKVPKRVSFFSWTIANDGILTIDNFVKRAFAVFRIQRVMSRSISSFFFIWRNWFGKHLSTIWNMVLTCLMCIQNVYKVVQARKGSMLLALAMLYPFAVLLGGVLVWDSLSPSDIMGNYPHLVVLGTGLAFGFLVGRMILAHLCDEPKGLKTNMCISLLYLPFAIANVLTARLNDGVPLVDERLVLLLYCAFSVVLYLHFATSVIHEITTALGIYCFRITRKEA